MSGQEPKPPVTWPARLAYAYLWTTRHALTCHLLPLSWAIRLTAPFYQAAADAGAWPEQVR